MKKIILTFSLISLSFSSVIAAQEQIKIGASIDLVEQQADSGQDIQNALNFANKEIAGNKYKLVIENDWCDSGDAAAVAKKLLEIDKINYVFAGCNNVVNFTASEYAAKNILMFAPLSSSADPAEDSSNVLRAAPSDEKAATMIIDDLNKNYTSYGIISEESELTKAVSLLLAKATPPAGITALSETYGSSSGKTLQSAVAAFKDRNLQAILINTASAPTTAAVIKEIKNSGISASIYSIRIPDKKDKINEGVIFTDLPGYNDILSDEGKKLIEKYTSLYGQPKSSEFAVIATIELFRALHLSAKQEGNIKDYLLSNSFEGIFGKFSFDKSGNITGLSHTLRQIKNGSAVAFNKKS